MVKRPVSVAISCWFLVIGSLSALVSAYLGRNDPAMQAWMADGAIPAEVQYAILIFSQGITLVAALAMLQRQRGARTVYLVWGVIDIAFCLATLPQKMYVLPGALLFAVICALLYSPRSNAWFSPRKAANDACMTPA
ncbi:hypothetical protein IGS61_15365 [Janthinobacterium sp. FW305-129]|uniref:hypothetical protein n=1 Tax=Janthinobacterium sp. FW305-129 TaxID=2775054 RepID=UPI001E469CD4|nr:hypothetical protein [Janthinobacterium sp. FW305-129]MCC7598874.1 hypothetical protein [Janthinobacterium sp. FW305-129]